MFIGEYQHNLDEKGRLSVPKKFRATLRSGVVLTKGLDNCLFLYTKVEWKKLAEKIASLPFSQANSRAFARLMLAGAMDLSLDKQGRITIPDYLRNFANLKKEVVVVGLYNRLELWSKDKWEKYRQSTEKESNKIAEQMTDLFI